MQKERVINREPKQSKRLFLKIAPLLASAVIAFNTNCNKHIDINPNKSAIAAINTNKQNKIAIKNVSLSHKSETVVGCTSNFNVEEGVKVEEKAIKLNFTTGCRGRKSFEIKDIKSSDGYMAVIEILMKVKEDPLQLILKCPCTEYHAISLGPFNELPKGKYKIQVVDAEDTIFEKSFEIK